MNDRFVVVTRQIAAPGRGRNFYYPAEVRVMDRTQSEWHALRGLNDGVKYRKKVCGTKYSGPRSEYGRALNEAKQLANKLNASLK
jgi:hypothetical protein